MANIKPSEFGAKATADGTEKVWIVGEETLTAQQIADLAGGGSTATPTVTEVDPAGATHTLTHDPSDAEILVTDQNLAITPPAYGSGLETIEFFVLFSSSAHTVTFDGTDITTEVENHPTVEDNLLVKYLAENAGHGWTVQAVYSRQATSGDTQDLNYLAWSEKFDETATWIATDGGGVTLTEDTGDASGAPAVIETNAWELQRDGGFPRLKGVPAENLASTGDYTHSVYAKASGTSTLTLRVVDLSGATNELEMVTFDLSTGTITSDPNNAASIEDVGNGWYRCIVTATHPSTNNQQFWIIPGLYDSAGAGDTIYAAGAQSEPGAEVTEYDYTNGTALT